MTEPVPGGTPASGPGVAGSAGAARPLRYIASLDGLRCAAAVAVILGHAGSFYPASPRLLSQGGLLVVTLLLTFLTTSGFLIYRSLVAPQMRPGSPRARPGEGGRHFGWVFTLRRFLRIFPLYWAVLAAKCLTSGAGDIHGPVDWFQIVFLFPLPDPSVLVDGGLGFATWTLTVELPFYVVMPLFAAGTARLARGRLRGWSPFDVQVLCVGSVLGVFAGASLLLRAPEALVLCALPLGMLLAVLEVEQWSRGRRFAALAWLGDRWWLCLLLFAGVWQLGAALAYRPGSPTSVAHLARSALLANMVLMFAGVVVAFVTLCFGRRSPLSILFGSLPLQMLASLTYGVYLWHPVVLQELAVRYGRGLWVLMAGTVLVSLTLALVTSLLVEAPLAALRYGLDARLGRTPNLGQAWAPIWIRPGSWVVRLVTPSRTVPPATPSAPRRGSEVEVDEALRSRT